MGSLHRSHPGFGQPGLTKNIDANQNPLIADVSQYILDIFENSYNNNPVKKQTKEDPLIGLLGETTNVILYSIFRTNLGKEYSRNTLRRMVEERKREASKRCLDAAAKIQSGKLAVDYWIDYLVQSGAVEKRISNPVMFKMVSDQLHKAASPDDANKVKSTMDVSA